MGGRSPDAQACARRACIAGAVARAVAAGALAAVVGDIVLTLRVAPVNSSAAAVTVAADVLSRARRLACMHPICPAPCLARSRQCALQALSAELQDVQSVHVRRAPTGGWLLREPAESIYPHANSSGTACGLAYISKHMLCSAWGHGQERTGGADWPAPGARSGQHRNALEPHRSVLQLHRCKRATAQPTTVALHAPIGPIC